MRRALAATLTAGIALAAVSVHAADYTPRPAYQAAAVPMDDFNWGGLYGGIHVGAATGTIEPSAFGLASALDGAATQLGVPLPVPSLPNLSKESAFFGGYAGFNWQWENVVIGIEGSYSTFNGKFGAVSIGAAIPGAVGIQSVSQTFQLQDVAVAALRGGVPFGRFMPYATLGIATGRASSSTILTANNGAAVATGGQYKSGWLVGAAAGLGLEYAVTDNLLLRTEYQWLGFTRFNGSSSLTGANPTLQTIRAGIAVKY
jgi:outer membrane immunogenic protein